MSSPINLVLFSDGTYLYTHQAPESIMKLRPNAQKAAVSEAPTDRVASKALPCNIRVGVAAPKRHSVADSVGTGVRSPVPIGFPPPDYIYAGHWCACGDGGYVWTPIQTPCHTVQHADAYWEMILRIDG